MIFQNISNFYAVKDYLPIINATIIVDLFVIGRLVSGSLKSRTLREWYQKFELGAFMADVLSIIIGIVIARFVYTRFISQWNLLLFLVIVVMVQLVHDSLFAWFFNSVPRGFSAVLDVFKDYAKEMGGQILIADALMVSFASIFASLLCHFSTNTNIVLLIVLAYLTPYFVYSV
jgi:uncharacterized protein YacL